MNKLEIPDIRSYIYNCDICLFCETWSNEHTDMDLEGYECKPVHRQRHINARRDSGGLVVYFKEQLSAGISIVKVHEDCVIWLKLCKNFFHVENDLMLALCYSVPENSGRQVFIENDVFDMLFADIAEFDVKYTNTKYIITGDFNARTATENDYIENDQADYVPLPDDYVIDTVPPKRISKDKHPPTNYGWKLLDLCKSCSLRIINGRIGKDREIGEYTYHSTRGSSVVDYIICSNESLNLVSNFEILDIGQEVSDHNMLMCTIKTKLQDDTTCDKPVKKYSWDVQKRETFRNNLIHVKPDIETVVNEICDSSSYDEIIYGIHTITGIIQSVADPLFSKVVRKCGILHQKKKT